MRRAIVLVLLLSFCMIILNLLTLLSVRTYKQRVQRTYEITESTFADAVNNAVSNYLARIPADVAKTNNISSKVFSRRQQDIITCFDYTRNIWYCYCEGVRYYRGDYFDDMVIISISEGRVYCRSSDGIIVLRPSRSATATPAVASRGRREEEQEDSSPF